MEGLAFAFSFSLILYLLAALASWMGGAKYVHREEAAPEERVQQAPAE
jgi:hypothetical protein